MGKGMGRERGKKNKRLCVRPRGEDTERLRERFLGGEQEHDQRNVGKGRQKPKRNALGGGVIDGRGGGGGMTKEEGKKILLLMKKAQTQGGKVG